MNLVYFSPVELVINQDVYVVVLGIKTVLIHQDVAVITYEIPKSSIYALHGC